MLNSWTCDWFTETRTGKLYVANRKLQYRAWQNLLSSLLEVSASVLQQDGPNISRRNMTSDGLMAKYIGIKENATF
jgi:hypothetical protein